MIDGSEGHSTLYSNTYIVQCEIGQCILPHHDPRTQCNAQYTVKLVLRNVWSLVPTLIVNVPGSTTHVFWSDHNASSDELTGIVTTDDSPAL